MGMCCPSDLTLDFCSDGAENKCTLKESLLLDSSCLLHAVLPLRSHDLPDALLLD